MLDTKNSGYTKLLSFYALSGHHLKKNCKLKNSLIVMDGFKLNRKFKILLLQLWSF